jgi:YesN/AraC family two-component response regulator
LGKKYEIALAEDGAQGLHLLEEHADIEFVISDLRMPGMSGLEFIQKAKVHHPQKKYYILSGYSVNAEIQNALDSGLILQFFTKPARFEAIDQAFQQEAD